MNVYDFDNTIFCPDSSYLFIVSNIKKHPRWFTGNLDTYLLPIVQYLKNHDISPLKECYFSFLKFVPDIDECVDDFWNENFNRIEQWYINQKKDNDIIISASPEFLLKPVADRLGVNLIATDMDKFSGAIKGSNNRGLEKVKRFSEFYSLDEIDNFYSDSTSDLPMAKYAKNAFIVKNHIPSVWKI